MAKAALLGGVLLLAVAATLIGNVRRVELVSKSSLNSEIAELDQQLGLTSSAASGDASRKAAAKGPRRAQLARKSALHQKEKGADAKAMSKQDALATAMSLWGQPKLSQPWLPENQEAYDKAVDHAQIAERGGVEVYHPLMMAHRFTDIATKENALFEGQLAHLLKLLEPSYLSEALDWAASGDSDDNEVRPHIFLSAHQFWRHAILLCRTTPLSCNHHRENIMQMAPAITSRLHA
jgi:hypothetical protein